MLSLAATLASLPAIIATMIDAPRSPDTDTDTDTATADADQEIQARAFIARWQGVALTEATELSSSQTFVLELCALLGVPTPLPT